MVNLLITTYCNNACPYCFAKQKVELGKDYKANPDEEITLENVKKVIEFFKDIKYMGILGGEPTLHPHFKEIVEMFINAGYRVLIFTNGRFNEDILDFLKKIPRTNVLFNINEPKFYYPREAYDQIVHNVVELAKVKRDSVSLGINFFYLEQDYHHILDIAKKGEIKTIRFDVAHPIVNEKNVTIPLEKYPIIGKKIADLVEEAGKLGISVNADCGATVWCMFDEESRKKLFKGNIQRFFEICVNGGAIDIGPDLKIWRCFPLSRYLNKRLDEFKNLREIQEYFNEKYSFYFFDFYPMDKCYDCKYAIRNQCIGSCLARSIAVYQQREDWFYKNYYYDFVVSQEKFIHSLYIHSQLKKDNPSFVKIIKNLEELKNIKEGVLLTDYLQNFDPLKFSIFKSLNLQVLPEKIEVYGNFANTSKFIEIKKWRKTKNFDAKEFIEKPILLYETDFKSIKWYVSLLKRLKANSFVIFYVAYLNGKIFNSLLNQKYGFQWILPLENEKQVDLKKYIEVNYI